MNTIEVRVPAIGGFKDVGIIDVLVKPGDDVKVDDSLITLESDKATMDVPSPFVGTVRELRVKLGDRVSEGSIILTLTTATDNAAKPQPIASPRPPEERSPAPPPAAVSKVQLPRGPVDTVTRVAQPSPTDAQGRGGLAHASPSVRRIARELGVDLARVVGSGPKGRIQQTDVQSYVKQAMRGIDTAGPAGKSAGAVLDLLPWPRLDFAQFGAIETRPLSRIRRISGANLARNWVMIPHVTQFDEADVTDLEAFRAQLNRENQEAGTKVTLLAFVVKACVAALRRFPELNASLDGESLVLKRYYHIGFAADTPNGLVVPVVKDADAKGVMEIARELSGLAAKARGGKLSPTEMSGGSFSISSLGGIGGTAFTPIINAPEVAILGVSRGVTRPFWDGRQFVPRSMLPLSLSYDHRVIDGATAVRFTSYLSEVLADMRRAML
jgi:pyruvate dehydrogenase E2 component (dihydrolipoamide acetyltransferase)